MLNLQKDFSIWIYLKWLLFINWLQLHVINFVKKEVVQKNRFNDKYSKSKINGICEADLISALQNVPYCNYKDLGKFNYFM